MSNHFFTGLMTGMFVGALAVAVGRWLAMATF